MLIVEQLDTFTPRRERVRLTPMAYLTPRGVDGYTAGYEYIEGVVSCRECGYVGPIERQHRG